MQKLDTGIKFLFRHGSQLILSALALYGLVEYLDFNRGFDHALSVIFVVLLAKEAFIARK